MCSRVMNGQFHQDGGSLYYLFSSKIKILNEHSCCREMLRELNNELKWASFEQRLISVAVTKRGSGGRTRGGNGKRKRLLDLWNGQKENYSELRDLWKALDSLVSHRRKSKYKLLPCFCLVSRECRSPCELWVWNHLYGRTDLVTQAWNFLKV